MNLEIKINLDVAKSLSAKVYTVQYAAIKKIIRGWRGRLVGMFLYYPGA